MDETRTLARFVANTSYDDLPTIVVERTKDYILDQLGCQIAFATLPWCKGIYRFVKGRAGPPESTIAYYGTRISADNAAFANASFAHAYEYDDACFAAETHP